MNTLIRCFPFLQKEGIPELTSEDYFSKNNEFATWLKEKKRTYFNDLTTESARELFSRFVKAWNRGKLESRYYEGISTAPRTAHNWKIKQKWNNQTFLYVWWYKTYLLQFVLLRALLRNLSDRDGFVVGFHRKRKLHIAYHPRLVSTRLQTKLLKN